jgi:hypothetical protein
MVKLILLTLSILAFAQLANAEYLCPQGIGALSGDKPFYIYTSKQGRKLAFCGWSENQKEGIIKAAEYEVIDTFNDKVLLRFGATDATFIKENEGMLTITQVIYLPSGDNWKYLPVNRYIYRLRETNGEISINKEYVFKPPQFDKKRISEVLQAYKILKETKYGNESISGMLMLAALSGSQEAQKLLMNLRDYLILDGASGEEYSIVMDVYDEYINNREHNKLLKGDAAKSRPAP